MAKQSRSHSRATREKISAKKREQHRRAREAIAEQPTHKRCSKCGVVKPVEEFYTKKRTLKSGFVYIYPAPPCKECERARVKASTEKAIREGRRAEIYERQRRVEKTARRRRQRREWAAAKRRREGRPAKGSYNGSNGYDLVPSEPFREFLLERLASGETKAEIETASGVPERRLFDVERGISDRVALRVVDAVLVGLGCPGLLNEMYPPGEDEEKLVGYHYLDLEEAS